MGCKTVAIALCSLQIAVLESHTEKREHKEVSRTPELWHHDHAMTFAEIARRLNLNPQTVMFHYNCAIQKLIRDKNSLEFSELKAAVAEQRRMIDHREANQRIFQDEPIEAEI
jgi:hypothetical protein